MFKSRDKAPEFPYQTDPSSAAYYVKEPGTPDREGAKSYTIKGTSRLEAEEVEAELNSLLKTIAVKAELQYLKATPSEDRDKTDPEDGKLLNFSARCVFTFPNGTRTDQLDEAVETACINASERGINCSSETSESIIPMEHFGYPVREPELTLAKKLIRRIAG